jgi:aspartate/methionine/tyrosine aminotransferase
LFAGRGERHDQEIGLAGFADCRSRIQPIQANQRRLYERLASVDCVELGAPARGGMYAFFRIKGLNDSLSFCK